jgi:dTDP-4-dehydrorhamnose reductase
MNKSNCKIFQIATDCVFSGSKGNYNEKNLHDAFDVYGKSKSLGEINNKNFYGKDSYYINVKGAKYNIDINDYYDLQKCKKYLK